MAPAFQGPNPQVSEAQSTNTQDQSRAESHDLLPEMYQRSARSAGALLVLVTLVLSHSYRLHSAICLMCFLQQLGGEGICAGSSRSERLVLAPLCVFWRETEKIRSFGIRMRSFGELLLASAEALFALPWEALRGPRKVVGCHVL